MYLKLIFFISVVSDTLFLKECLFWNMFSNNFIDSVRQEELGSLQNISINLSVNIMASFVSGHL